MERVLVAGGFLHLSTDVRGYFDVIREVLREHTRLREADDASPEEVDGGDELHQGAVLQCVSMLNR